MCFFFINYIQHIQERENCVFVTRYSTVVSEKLKMINWFKLQQFIWSILFLLSMLGNFCILKLVWQSFWWSVCQSVHFQFMFLQDLNYISFENEWQLTKLQLAIWAPLIPSNANISEAKTNVLFHQAAYTQAMPLWSFILLCFDLISISLIAGFTSECMCACNVTLSVTQLPEICPLHIQCFFTQKKVKTLYKTLFVGMSQCKSLNKGITILL